MPEDMEANGTEVSDVMSENENEYDDQDHLIKDDDDDEEEDEKMAEHNTSPETGAENSADVKKKYDPKDPHRPRRKKARRACFACQRAHLTCGKSSEFIICDISLSHTTPASTCDSSTCTSAYSLSFAP